MRRYKRFDCVENSKIYNSILHSKNNRKVLENGDIRIGDKLKLNKKTSLIEKI